MYNLICITYNKTEQGLVLSNSWIEKNRDKDYVEKSLEQFEIQFDISNVINLSTILEGKFGSKVIHLILNKL